jgi:acyl carrier protein
MATQIDTTPTLERLTEIFREAFNNDDLAISRETTARDIPEWDSLMHVSLLLNVERVFGVQFLSAEVVALQSVGELADMVDAKLKS